MADDVRERSDAYYKDAATWADDRTASLARSRRTAWIVAIIATAVAAMLALAIFVLLPLKTVIPYTLLVDRQTGFVQTLDPIERSRIAPDAALTQSFLVQYVLAREGYDRVTVQTDYRKVTLWSEDDARRDYVAFMQASNPISPLIALPRDAVIEARIRSVSPLGTGGTSLVRFETIRRDRGGSAAMAQYWVAVVRYRYSNDAMAVEDRYLNPLGFQVTSYRRNAETLPVVVEPPVVPATAPSVATPQTTAPAPQPPMAGPSRATP